MALYRARPADGTAWVTGASTGLGRTLALDLARAGYTVAATARSEDKLADLAREAAGLAGRVMPFACDVTDRAAMADTLAAIETQAGPVALAVFNAGTFQPLRGERFEVEPFVKTIEINVFGVVHGLAPLIERMRARGRGQIAITGSVTAYFGLPSAAAYGASKAALNNMAEALRFDLEKLNIRIQMINPGFVDTPLTKKNRFAMPALMPAEKAAARIVQALRTGGFETTFPRRFTWSLKALRLFPHAVVHPVLNRATGWHRRNPAARD
ncbi:SDR family NAD(P)-dependent oxidoreductase [Aquibium sp. A9E412]|uniref:SDR family NAD(P)-dependent oxidoreductase n=1 Tax=Aquibium sp. A9E412 TaxID=2976767 RepID=UPI0025AF44A7|nr:SDR family NAD(P)-dependent oxidoreductase [Aquibium sp. A9E412]MDN2565986.1 SDR family NAD(P)-dependent oxidoreductase [Aquibium sp. A9E412]